MVDIRIGYQWIFTDDIKGFEGAVVGRRYHLGGRQAGLVGKLVHIPGLLHALARCGINDFLISGIHIRQPAHVTGALDVVLTAQRIDTTARDAQVAAKHGQVGQ